MNLEKAFTEELERFINDFSERYNCNVGLRLPKYFEQVLIANEVDLTNGFKVIPFFTPRQEKEKIES